MIKVVNCIPQLWNTDVLEIKLDEVDALFACSCLKAIRAQPFGRKVG